MRKHFNVHNRYGDQRQSWGWVLIVLALLFLFAKPWIFPLLLIVGGFWFAGWHACGWHGFSYEDGERRKRKAKNDDSYDDDSEVVII